MHVGEQVGADMAQLAQALQKPLRPLWLSQESRMWLDDVPALDSLPFIPIMLVSASKPNARQRCPTGAQPGVVFSCRIRQLYCNIWRMQALFRQAVWGGADDRGLVLQWPQRLAAVGPGRLSTCRVLGTTRRAGLAA